MQCTGQEVCTNRRLLLSTQAKQILGGAKEKRAEFDKPFIGLERLLECCVYNLLLGSKESIFKCSKTQQQPVRLSVYSVSVLIHLIK